MKSPPGLDDEGMLRISLNDLMRAPLAPSRPTPPWVINLATENCPIQDLKLPFLGYGRFHRYQLTTTEEGRTFHRLRMGPFSDRAAAQQTLATVRSHFPAAFVAHVTPADLRAMARMQSALIAAARKKHGKTSNPPVLRSDTDPAAALTKAPSVITPSAFAPPIRHSLLADSLIVPDKPPRIKNAETFIATKAAALPFDQTQTLRAPPIHAHAPSEHRWLSIELSRAEKPFDPDTLPNLDIFKLFRLYAVPDPSKEMFAYSLRLGFFSSDTDALAVARYLSEHFGSPQIRYISNEEHARFISQQLEARKVVDETGTHTAIELSGNEWRGNRGLR